MTVSQTNNTTTKEGIQIMEKTMEVQNQTVVEEVVETKKKVKSGRPYGNRLDEYRKVLIREAGTRKRCEDSQECLVSLFIWFSACLKKNPNVEFWISATADAAPGLFVEDRYKQRNADWYIYHCTKVSIPADSRRITSSYIEFTRTNYPETYNKAPLTRFQIVDILQRMLSNNSETTVYFLDKNLEKAFIEGCQRIITNHPYDTEHNKLIRNNYYSIMSDIDNHPEKFDIATAASYWNDHSNSYTKDEYMRDPCSENGISLKNAIEDIVAETRNKICFGEIPGETYGISEADDRDRKGAFGSKYKNEMFEFDPLNDPAL